MRSTTCATAWATFSVSPCLPSLYLMPNSRIQGIGGTLSSGDCSHAVIYEMITCFRLSYVSQLSPQAPLHACCLCMEQQPSDAPSACRASLGHTSTQAGLGEGGCPRGRLWAAIPQLLPLPGDGCHLPAQRRSPDAAHWCNLPLGRICAISAPAKLTSEA